MDPIILRNKRWFAGVMAEQECAHCGARPLPVKRIRLEWHHRKGTNYSPGNCKVSHLVNSRSSLDRIREEMAKCHVLCSSCHNSITASKKFSDAQVKEIRDLGKTGMPIAQIARKFETSAHYIHDLIRFRKRKFTS